MSDAALSRERILDAAEEVLRRYGPAKTTVVDVARALGVSHGTVYRHFASKAALRDAVAERWLARISAPLAEIAAEENSAIVRLRRWLDQIIAAKQDRARDDPELFAAYVALAAEAREVIRTHVEHLRAQVARIIADGVAQGEFAGIDPVVAGRAVCDATSHFHDPANVVQWKDADFNARFEGVWALIRAGLCAGSLKAD